MNHPSKFVRPVLWARAIGRRAAPSSCSPATLNHRQHGSTHERGRGVPELGMLSRASIHADGRRDLQSGFSTLYDVSLKTCRGLRGSGFFPILGSQPRRQAIADLPEVIHSKAPVPSPHDHEAKGVGSDQKAIGVSQNVVDC
jgi:hypothetical protein